jgi:hypothetical protein
MPTIEEVSQQLSRVQGDKKKLGGGEIKYLAQLLQNDEQIENYAKGRYIKYTGYAIATNKRVIFFYHVWPATQKSEDFTYGRINSVEYEGGGIFLNSVSSKIIVHGTGNKAEVDLVPREQGKEFSDFLRAKVHQAGEPSSAPSSSGGDDIIGKLERLAKLREQNLLSEAEFNEQKRRLLG